MSSIKGKHLTFYGHFTGWSSYPVVCRALARWLLVQGVDLRVANLRGKAIEGDLGLRQIPVSPQVMSLVERRVPVSKETRKGAGLLFGFPSWYQHIPRHSPMIGYHVGDLSPLPTAWYGQIIKRCDAVLTPSRWSADLLQELGLELPIHVVRHGIDPKIFKPTGPKADGEKPGGPLVLRHYCSSPMLDRKGTVEVLRASQELLKRKRGCGPIRVCVSAPDESLPMIADFAGKHPGGWIEVSADVPTPSENIAMFLRGATAIVQPSRGEGFGLTVLESGACGTPVVTTNITGHTEFVASLSASALCVRTGDPQRCGGGGAPTIDAASLLYALERMTAERRRFQAWAQWASESIRREWSWDAMLDADLRPVLGTFL